MEDIRETFYAELRSHLNVEATDRASSKVEFSCREAKASANLLKLKEEVLANPEFSPYEMIHETKCLLESSALYKTIVAMPLGIVHHSHLPASISEQFFVELTYEDTIFYNREKGRLRCDPAESDLTDLGFVKLNELRAAEGDSVVDAEMLRLLSFNMEMFKKNCTKDIFSDFNSIFFFMYDILMYEPHFARMLENLVQNCIADGYQGVETRHVFRSLVRPDFTSASLDEEVEFLAQQKARLAAKYPSFTLTFIATSIKALDHNHFLSIADMYARSLYTHPGLITAYDMVDYEESKMLDEFIDDLIEYKYKHKDFTIMLHAGETFSYSNHNVAIATMLGSKRLGHGLTVMRSPATLELLKKHDVCVEVNPLSNYMLGYCRDLHWHPAKQMINYGIPITINSDDNLFWGVSIGSFDFMLAVLYWDFDLRDLKWCIANSFKYSSINKEGLLHAEQAFEVAWGKFIDQLSNL